MALSEDLMRLSQLFEAGELSAEEYAAAKESILAGRAATAGIGSDGAGSPAPDPRIPAPDVAAAGPHAAVAPAASALVSKGREFLNDLLHGTDWKAVAKTVVISAIAGCVLVLLLGALGTAAATSDASPLDAGIDPSGNVVGNVVKALLLFVAMAFRAPLSGNVALSDPLFGEGFRATGSVVFPASGVTVVLLGALVLGIRRSNRQHLSRDWRDAARRATAHGVIFSVFIAVVALLARTSLAVEFEGSPLELRVGLGVVVAAAWSLVLGTTAALIALRPRGMAAETTTPRPEVRSGVRSATVGFMLHIGLVAIPLSLYLIVKFFADSPELPMLQRGGITILAALAALPSAIISGGLFGLGGSLSAGAREGAFLSDASSIGLFAQQSLPAWAQVSAIAIALIAAYSMGLALRIRTQERGAGGPVALIATYAALWAVAAWFISIRASVEGGELGEMLGASSEAGMQVGFGIVAIIAGAVVIGGAGLWLATLTSEAAVARLRRSRRGSQVLTLLTGSAVALAGTAVTAPHAVGAVPVALAPPGRAFAPPDPSGPTDEPPLAATSTSKTWRVVMVLAVLVLIAGVSVAFVRQADRLEKAEGDLANTRTALESTRADLRDAESDLDATRSQLSETQAELDSSESYVANLEDSIASLNDEISMLNDEIASLEYDYSSTVADYPSDYGSDSYLDSLVEDCAASDYAACVTLYEESPVDSDYEWFGATCGYEYTSETCTEYDY